MLLRLGVPAEPVRPRRATGAIVRYDGKTRLLGTTPPPDVVEPLVHWLGVRAGGGVYTTHQLPVEFPAAAPYLDSACGVLATSFGDGAEGLVAWLRPEVVRMVSWAGNPTKATERDAQGKIGPRRSFAVWREQVHGQALPFEPWQREVADSLRRLLADVVLRRAAALRQANRELLLAVQGRDDFLSMASHELKTPLGTLLLTLDNLQRSLPAAGAEAERGHRRLDIARRQILRLDQIVTSLLDVSRIQAGRLEIALAEGDLAAVVRDVVTRMSDDTQFVLTAPATVACRLDRLRIDALATAGHEVVAAPDGKSALDLLTASPTRDLPAAIVLDWMMPRMHGLEFRRLQRADPRLAGIPVVLLTAATISRVPVAEIAPDAALTKPISALDLVCEVERVARAAGNRSPAQ